MNKADKLIVKTIQPRAIKVAQALAAFCPSKLQTNHMVSTNAMQEAVPLVNREEWEHYITLPTQQPAPSSTSGRIDWWKSRLADFPTLAAVAIAYLLTPRSSSQAERSFSLLGHTMTGPFGILKGSSSAKEKCAIPSQGPAISIQTDDRLNMLDSTLDALAFVYINKKLFTLAE